MNSAGSKRLGNSAESLGERSGDAVDESASSVVTRLVYLL